MAALQVRNFPEDLHDRLRQRAEAENRSISDVVIQILNRELARPKMHNWLDLVAKTPDVRISAEEIVEIIHEGRAER